MLSFLSGRMAALLVDKQIINEDEKAIYEYGIDLLISAIVSFVIMIIIGLITGQLIESIIFYVCFVLLRTYTGGYHAKTRLKCKIFFASAQIIALLMAEILARVSVLYSMISVAICVILIFQYAPVENVNKKINDPVKMKRRALSIVIILCLMGVFSNIIFPKSFVTIVSTMLIVTELIVWDVRINGASKMRVNLEHGN